MSIIETTNHLRKLVRSSNGIEKLAKEIGVTYSWLSKFSDGRIANPTVDNLAKVERFFIKKDSSPKDTALSQ